MAIISCPECGRNVSDQAPACPDCAYPIAASTPAGSAAPPPTPSPAATPAPTPSPSAAAAGPQISEQRLATAGWWALLGALVAAGGLVLIWVTANWDNAGAGFGGVAAGVIAIGLGNHANGIARRAAVHEPDAGRLKRRRAELKAVRQHAPLAGAAVFLGVIAVIGNLLLLIGEASN